MKTIVEFNEFERESNKYPRAKKIKQLDVRAELLKELRGYRKADSLVKQYEEEYFELTSMRAETMTADQLGDLLFFITNKRIAHDRLKIDNKKEDM